MKSAASSSWFKTLKGKFARRVVVVQSSIIAAQWSVSGAATALTPGATNSEFGVGAVDPDKFGLGEYGQSLSAAVDGSSPIYHIVISDAGVKSWVPTTGTVAGLVGA